MARVFHSSHFFVYEFERKGELRMPKQLNVNLAFTADTKQVKGQLQELQQYLSKLTTNANKSPLGITTEISEAINKTTQLQVALEKATSKTGKLDLGQFRQELNKANLSAEQIAASLSALGSEGQTAFAKLAQSVSLAEVPIRRTNRLLQEFTTTLRNTAKWQISSSILHGFIGSVQSAYRYAQDLNNSLNDIRIVTGQSTEQMAEFARQANESAKALSSTTTAYTDAALIFYQQGLDDKAVQERTDTVIKMSNVTGEAVKDVSSYMTAIWNNFDDGSQSLEHYADVITALGAATASSSEEIANGLEKFAAIGETVGLSYDYATAALATVVATTRQSEDVVGTAFKTIFARMQGLQLGETLEDGTTLNKYSKALEAVGISIKDQNEQLKNMDDILDELGDKWNTLEKDEQSALAQTIAGTRQYTQLLALMSNWDFFKENVEIAKNSQGTLQEQADIYAESWEAASKEVKASLQDIYNQLLNDKFFIQINNGFSKVLDSISNTIDALGGLRGILPLIGTLVFKIFGPDISNSINNIIYNFKLMTKSGREEIYTMRTEWISALKDMIDETTVLGQAQQKVLESQVSVQEAVLNKTLELEQANLKLSDGDQERLKRILDINKAIGDQYIELSKLKEQQEGSNSTLKVGLRQQINATQGRLASQITIEELQTAESLQQQYTIGTQIVEDFKEKLKSIPDSAEGLKVLITDIENLENSFKETGTSCIEFKEQLASLKNVTSIEDFKNKLKDLENVVDETGINAETIFNDIIIALEQSGLPGVDKVIKKIQDGATVVGDTERKILSANTNINNNVKTTTEEVKKLKGELPGVADQWMAIGRTMMSISMIVSSLKGLIDTLSDSTKTTGEKALAIFSSLGILIPTVISSLNGLKTALGGATAAQWSLNVAMDANPAGVIALAITALIGVIAGAVVLIDKFTMSVEEANEQLNKLNQDMKDFASSKTSINNKIEELKQLADEYDNLSDKAGKYDKEIENLTDEERKRYNEIKDIIVDVNEKTLGYYNSQGEAILKNNNALQDTIDLLKEEIELDQQKYYNDKAIQKDIKAYDTQYQSANLVEESAKNRLNTYKTEKYQGYYRDEITTSYKIISDIFDQMVGSNISEKERTVLYDLSELLNKDIETIAKNKNEIKEYVKILQNNQSMSEVANEELNKAADTIIKSVNNYIKIIDDAEVELSEAEEKASLAAKNINSSFIYGLIKYNKEKNKEYELLKNMGIENADSYILAYITGLELGIDADDTEGLIQKVQDFETELASLFSKNLSLEDVITETNKNYNAINFDSYQDYINKTQQEIINFLQSNSDVLNSSEEIKQAILKAIFGIDNISFDESGFITDFEDPYEKKINDLRLTLQNKANEGKDVVFDYTFIDPAQFDIPSEFLDDIDKISTYINDTTLKTQGWEAALNEALEKLKEIKEIEDYSQKIQTTTGLIDSLISGKELTEDQLNTLKELENEYEILGTIQDRNSLNYLNRLIEIREALEKEQLVASQNYENNLISQATNIELVGENGEPIEDNITAFQEKLKEICEADYEIQVQITSDIQDDFDTIVSKMETIEDASSKIGEGYTVAAEDLEELNEVFPGIISNMELVGDGTVKLNEEMVQSAMDAAKAEVGADTEKTVEKLQNQADELAARRDAAKTIAEIAHQMVNTKKMSSEDEARLDTALRTLESTNSDALKTQEEADYKSEADAAAEAASSMAQSLGKFAEVSLLDIIKWAREYRKAIDYGTKQSSTPPSPIQFVGKTWSTKSNMAGASASNKADLAGYESFESVDDWQAVADYYDNLAASYDSAYNNTMGKMAEILARAQGSGNTLDNVAAGNGAKGNNKSSSGSKNNKQKEVKELKDFYEEFDQFYPINKAIKDVTDALKDLNKQQEHLSGQNLINSLKKQNELLQDQHKLYRDLIKQQQNYRDSLAGPLQSFGATFDAATGNITNYTDLVETQLAKYNAAVVTYNNSAQDEVAKSALSAAEKNYNAFKDYLSKYQKILTDIEDTQNNLDDILYEQIENNFKAFEVDIQLDLDLEEARRQINDFIRDINVDFKKAFKSTKEWADLFDVAAKNSKTYSEAGGTIDTDLKKLREIAEIIDNSDYNYMTPDSMFADRTEAIKAYKDASDQLMKDGKDFYELYKSSWDSYLDAIDEADKQWDDMIKGYDKINKTLDHYQKITELLYDEESDLGREYLDQLYEASAQTSLAEQEVLKTRIASLQKEYDEILAMGGNESEEDLRKIAEQIEDANDELNSQIESYLQTIQDQLINSIHSIMSTADKAMTQGYGMQTISERWKDAQDAAEGYYDDVQRIYQLQKAENNWQDLINSTKNLKTQQYLKGIMDSQLENLKSKTKLSEYDVQLAEKELEVQRAYVALQDAQNNKNSMKLVRNKQGNWSYQYVADQDDVANKQQNFLDALNEKYTFTKEQSEKAVESLMNLYTEANDRLTSLLEEYKYADEDRRAKIKEEYNYLYETYYGSEGLIAQKAQECSDMQNDIAYTMMQLLEGHYEVNETNFGNMTTAQQKLFEELKDSGITNFEDLSLKLGNKDAEDTIYGGIYKNAKEVINEQDGEWKALARDIVTSWAGEENKNSVSAVIQNVYETAKTKVQEYDDKIKKSEFASGQNWTKVKTEGDATAASIANINKQLDELLAKNDALSTYKGIVDSIGTQWDGVKNSIEKATKATEDYLEALREPSEVTRPDYVEDVNPQGEYNTGTSGGSGGGKSGGSGGGGNGGPGGGGKSTTVYTVHYEQSGEGLSYDYDSIEKAHEELSRPGAHGYVEAKTTTSTGKQETTVEGDKTYGLQIDKNKKANVTVRAYATGGYTGDWNSTDGRLAILHEKELVLNKEDTSNILDAVNMVRGISNLSSLVSNVISSNLAGMALGLSGLSPNGVNANTTSNSNNIFNITAEFPNAENVNEIREAILSLPTLASQYLSQR